MKETILSRLQSLDEKILFAVESGSRAWGIDSVNSDYDVRFVYHRSKEQYLKLFRPKRDTVEIMEEAGLLDYAGWDIFKYLKLLAKSNPSAIEWLYSPIIYIDNQIRLDLQKVILKEKKEILGILSLKYFAKTKPT